MHNDYVIEVRDLKKWFPLSEGFFSGLFRRRGKFTHIRAVDGISFEISKGEILGLAGESGCGKTTTGMTVLGLYEASSGKIIFDGSIDITRLKYRELKTFRRNMQIIFQDPYQSLNPRHRVFNIISEPLNIHRIGTAASRIEEVLEALERAELIPPKNFLDAYPHQLSGGQRQRITIARAIVLEPKFIVADEPVSMLDVSIRASILNLLRNFSDNMGMAILYISHDLSTIRHICDRTAIMYLGKIVEIGLTERILIKPLHPYTHALISSVPVPDPFYKRQRVELFGEVSVPIDSSRGCRFRHRCKRALEICKVHEPVLRDVGDGHKVACHLF